MMFAAKRIQSIQSAVFFELDSLKKQLVDEGVDLIDLGIGSPDLPPPKAVMEALSQSANDPSSYGYPTSQGSLQFRTAVASWYLRRFGIQLDPETEVLALMGSQEGLTHLATAVVDPGDIVLVPDPGYPIYSVSIQLANGELVPYTLSEENQYLLDLDAIPSTIADKAKLMIINYPNNPLSAVADRAFFERIVEFANRHRILIAQDMAYSELAFDGYKPMSILEVPGAKEIAVEFHTLSKSYNMAGCRIGFIVGNAEAIRALSVVKSNIDYGVFLVVQDAAIAALTIDHGHTAEMSRVYQTRRDALIDGLAKSGWNISKPKATMFVWAKIPTQEDSRSFARRLLMETGIAVVPGIGFGQHGEGYVRMALVQNEQRLAEAAVRVQERAWWSR